MGHVRLSFGTISIDKMAKVERSPTNPIMNAANKPKSKGQTKVENGVLKIFDGLTDTWSE